MRTVSIAVLSVSSAVMVACGGVTAIAGDDGATGVDATTHDPSTEGASGSSSSPDPERSTTSGGPASSATVETDPVITTDGSSSADSSDSDGRATDRGSSEGGLGTSTVTSVTEGETTTSVGVTAGGSSDDGTAGTSGAPCCGETGGSTTDASTTGDGGPGGLLPFVDITVAAGLTHDQGTPATPPNCLVDAVNPNLPGFFCGPERYAGGAAVADYDGDGRLDVFITRPTAVDLLYRNQGGGTFLDVAAEVGIVDTLGSAGAAFADVDNDGDQDLYVTSVGEYRHWLYIQEGGVFTEQAEERGAGIPSEYQHEGSTPAFADYDLDGDLDLYVGEWMTHAVGVHTSHARLLRNLGPDQPGYFEDVTVAAGIAVDDVWQTVDGNLDGTFVLSVGWGDLDADGHPDLMLASDFDCSRLFWNSGDGTFIDGTVAAGVGTDENGMGSTAADYDRDGDFDWFVTSIVAPMKTGNRLYRNDGARSFSDATDEAGVRDSGWGWGTAFFDHDLDGDLDLAATNGWYGNANLDDPLVAWTQDGGVFTAQQKELGLIETSQGRALVTFDAEDDGDLEVLVVSNQGQVHLFRNDTLREGRHWLRVRAPGESSNRDGIGALVTVLTPDGTLRHEIGGTSHLLGHGPREAHFGLGQALTADVRVDWPASGQFVELDDVQSDQVLVVPEP